MGHRHHLHRPVLQVLLRLDHGLPFDTVPTGEFESFEVELDQPDQTDTYKYLILGAEKAN